jgi:hypothetical protein
MKRCAVALFVMAVALPLLSQVEPFYVTALDRVVNIGDFVRVSGGGVAPTPTPVPTEVPTEEPTQVPTEEPTEVPTEEPTQVPTEEPTEVPTEEPTEVPTEEPTEEPTEVPTEEPTEEPTEVPTEVPMAVAKQVPGEVLIYTLCLMPNAEWSAVTEVDCEECLETTGVETENGTFAEELLGPIPLPGGYDVLLLEGTCNGPLTLLASDGQGDEPAVTAPQEGHPVPSILVPGAVMLLALLALTGAIILRRS